MVGIEADVAVLVQDYPLAGLDGSKGLYWNDAQAFAGAVKGTPAAICATIPENLDQGTREALVAAGIAPMQGLHEALNAFAQGAAWAAARARILAAPPAPLRPTGGSTRPAMVSEAEGKAWVARAGIPIPEGLVASGQDAPRAAADLGGPVALKMLSARIAHKTEMGAVILGLSGPDEVEAAVARMARDVAARDPGAVTDSFLVERMSAPPLAELIVGIRRDPQFGHALTLGSGGILVELVRDAVTILLPASVADIETGLVGLKISTLMRGYRGGAKIEITGLAEALHSLCSAVLDADPAIQDIEINPLFVGPDGITAVDVLMFEAAR
jgi:acyl-CoA synthetase (NDP forming)